MASGREGKGVVFAHGERLAASLDGVCLETGGARVLSDISWDVRRGEKWVVLGPNGSGKTSLLRLLSGFGYPSRGAMQVLGAPFGRADLRALRRRVGWVHGDLAADFPGFMSCADVVRSGAEGSLALYNAKHGREAEQAAAALDSIGAGHLASRLFHTLSTGERQRALIARALAAEPQLMLLDEPCLGLDPRARDDFLESLTALFGSRPNLTVIAVTHYVEEIIEGYDRVLLLAGGMIAAKGRSDQVLTGPGMRRVYGERCRIELRDGRYAMRFARG